MRSDFEPTHYESRFSEDRAPTTGEWISQTLRHVGRWVAAPRAPMREEWVDSATGLFNKGGLSACGNEILANCQARGRTVSVVVFDFADLLEVRSIYGNRMTMKLMAHIAKKLKSLAGRGGLAARTGAAEFTVVMAGVRRPKALAAIESALGRPTRIEFDAGDSEIVLVPSFAVETSGPDVDSVEELYYELRATLNEEEEQQQRRQHYLQRERERHSRPMGISALVDSQRPASRHTRIHLAPTMPAPLVIQ